MKLITLVIKSVLRSKRRTILTVISMTFSFLIFAILLSTTTAISNFPNTISPFSLTLAPQEWGLNVPNNYIDRISKEIDGVSAVMGFIPLNGVMKSDENKVALAAIDADTLREVWPDKKNIDAAEYDEFKKDRKGAVVSNAVISKFGLKIGDNFTINKVKTSRDEVAPFNIELTIRAVSPSGAWGGQTYVHREYVDELIGRKGKVNMIVFNVKGEDYVPQAITDANEKFPGFSCQRADQSLANALATFQNINRLIIPITIGIIAAIILVAANSLAISIRARTSEIAVLKTLGFTNAAVQTIILIESTFISLVGGVLGCLIAFFAFNGMTLPIAQGAYFEITKDTIIGGIIASGIIGLVSGFIPAYRASRLRIVDALRRVA